MATKTCEITWTIENFPLLLGPESMHMDPLESSQFDSNVEKKPTDKLSFSLRLVPYFVDEQTGSKHVSLYLQLHTNKEFEKQVVWYKFTIYGFNGKEVFVKENQAKFDQVVRCLGFPQFISHSKLCEPNSSFILNKCLIINCQLSYKSDTELPLKKQTKRKLAELKSILEKEKIDQNGQSSEDYCNERLKNTKEQKGKRIKNFLSIFSLSKAGKYTLSNF